MGADVTIDAATEDPVARVEEETGGRGADLAVEMIGRTETFERAVLSVGAGGRVVVMGVARREARAQIGPFELMVKEVEVLGSNANAAAFIPAIRLLEAGAIQSKTWSATSSTYGMPKLVSGCVNRGRG